MFPDQMNRVGVSDCPTDVFPIVKGEQIPGDATQADRILCLDRHGSVAGQPNLYGDFAEREPPQGFFHRRGADLLPLVVDAGSFRVAFDSKAMPASE